MAVPLFLLPAIFLLFFPLQQSTTLVLQVDAQTPSCGDMNDHSLICELDQHRLRISRLESALEKHINDLSAKSISISQHEKLIDEMNNEIHKLQSAVSSDKVDLSIAEERIKMLEEEVRLLWVDSRKSNFELHNLKSKAEDADERLDVFASKLEKMRDIVSEQYIQIQQLEQAFQITQMRALKILSQVRPSCSFLNYVDNLLEPYSSALRSLISEGWHYLQRTLSAAKHLHHQFQVFIKKEMGKNDVTASLANNHEVVFFVASAIITFPIIVAWISLSPNFS